MARDSSTARNDERKDGDEEEAAGLLQDTREGSPDEDIVVHPGPRPKPGGPPRRQSSFAKPRDNGTPRTPHRVRFNVDDTLNEMRTPNGDAHMNGWIEEEDYMSSEEQNDSRGQRAPLLTDIEAPSVTLASEDVDFNAEDLLESARPKSGMQSAFMNMANSIMYVAPSVYLLSHSCISTEPWIVVLALLANRTLSSRPVF